MGGRTKVPDINMGHNPAQLLESVSRCTQNGFIGSDLNDKVTCFSPIIESLTGWKEEEVIGKDIEAFTSFLKKIAHLI